MPRNYPFRTSVADECLSGVVEGWWVDGGPCGRPSVHPLVRYNVWRDHVSGGIQWGFKVVFSFNSAGPKKKRSNERWFGVVDGRGEIWGVLSARAAKSGVQ